MCNIFAAFKAGFSVWSEGLRKHWKKILLILLLIPIAITAFSIFVGLLARVFLTFIIWTTTIPGWNNFCNNHPKTLAFGMLGVAMLYVLLFSLYQDGKKKLQQK